MKKMIFVAGIFLALVMNAGATTWFPSDKNCPACKTTSTFQVIGSYGGYIYSWPSKYQYLFWPLTDSPSVYCCPQCCYSTYMWDFDSIPENKLDSVKLYLATVKLDKKYEDYDDIPITQRLEFAEQIYKILGRDQMFWCKFYRVKGYHYDAEKSKTKAYDARNIALDIARTLLVDEQFKEQKKETLFIMAAMFNYTDRKDSALICLTQADKCTYRNKDWEKDNSEGLDKYLTEVIKLYKDIILKDEKIE